MIEDVAPDHCVRRRRRGQVRPLRSAGHLAAAPAGAAEPPGVTVAPGRTEAAVRTEAVAAAQVAALAAGPVEQHLVGARHEILGLVSDPDDVRMLCRVAGRARLVVAEGALPEVRQRGLLGGALRVGGLPGLGGSTLVVDRRLALTGTAPGPGIRWDWQVERRPGEVDRLVADFQSRWRRALDPRSWLQGGLRGRVLALLAGGHTDASVARKLDVSERTVQRQVKRAMDLLGVSSRLELGVELVRHRLL